MIDREIVMLKEKPEYEIEPRLVGSEMGIRDKVERGTFVVCGFRFVDQEGSRIG